MTSTKSAMIARKIFIFCTLIVYSRSQRMRHGDVCVDHDRHCFEWVARDGNECIRTPYVRQSCEKTCAICGKVDKKFDVRNMPDSLRPLSFLLGVWRADTGGKAVFPTIPVFTYGEQIEISLPDNSMKALKALNYTAFAWDMNNHDELHSEYGFIALKPGTREVALTTVMDNGFVTIEEGTIFGKMIRFTLRDVGRISFSRDLPVHGMIREWRLLDSETFENRLMMETLTHRMQMHTLIVYKKIYPK